MAVEEINAKGGVNGQKLELVLKDSGGSPEKAVSFAKQLIEEALTRATGLTSIAWGISPNAQTSGRAMSSEWRAVELPLTNRLLNQGVEAKELIECWWDYAEAYSNDARDIAKGGFRWRPESGRSAASWAAWY